jgi:hypothetical protein
MQILNILAKFSNKFLMCCKVKQKDSITCSLLKIQSVFNFFFLLFNRLSIRSMSFNHFLKPFLFSMAKIKKIPRILILSFFIQKFSLFLLLMLLLLTYFFFLSWFHFCHHLQIIEKKKTNKSYSM